jgi:hypothetical protein
MGCIIFPINMITETSDKVCTMEYVDKEYIGKIFCKGLEQGYTLFAQYQIKHILTLV